MDEGTSNESQTEDSGLRGRQRTSNPPNDELKHECQRIATFGNNWNGADSAVRLAGDGFYNLDGTNAECRFCARVVPSGIVHEDLPHGNRCRIPDGTETENFSIRDRSVEDRDGEAALESLIRTKQERDISRQQYEGALPFLSNGMLQIFLERGYESSGIQDTIENFNENSGLFPNSTQLLQRLESDRLQKKYRNNIYIN